jgi:hypothetical protein
MAPRAKRGKVRGHGDGALYYSEALSRWVGVATVPDPTAREGRRRVKVTGREKSEAKDKLDDALRKIKEGVPVGSALETVADVLRYWLERGLDRKRIKSQNTVDGLTWAVEKHLIPAIGAYRIRELECEHVEDMLTKMAGNGMSTSSLTRVHTTLTRAQLGAASRQGLPERVRPRRDPGRDPAPFPCADHRPGPGRPERCGGRPALRTVDARPSPGHAAR